MASVWLVHGRTVDAQAQATRLRSAGHAVTSGTFDAAVLRQLKASPPDAVLIDLSTAPGLGRDVGLALRQARPTRHVPIVFVGGDSATVGRVRAHLPDAAYATWRGVRGAIRAAIERPLVSPVVPQSLLAGYSGTSLPRKLGIREGSFVRLAGAPKGFEQSIVPLPAGAKVTRSPTGAADVTLWFVRSFAELQREIGAMVPYGRDGGLWIVWPKRTSSLAADLTQADVRRVGLATGLVDFKVAAIDSTWAGLRFSIRKKRNRSA